ncbi:hypothetical protein Poly51_02340 [Rubripirellula tenax]|uniref:Uncharacterized protein n=2 Tax=Rubripirellula tenax TaxID=2528015 RepID=A0A5C6FEN5_9BACT|nr:hypothetical protein Poly51_02340 [Rubripirellula tenax]
MGATKQAQLEEMDWESSIHVENFMRANGVEVAKYDPSQFGFCIIDVAGSKVQGRLQVNLSLTRREAVGLLRGLGIPALDEMAG